ncbi:MAG: radical SAM protein [Patescibacteria group bacterium]
MLFKQPTTLKEIKPRYEVDRPSYWVKYFLKNHLLCFHGQNERQEIADILEGEMSEILRGNRLSSLSLIIDEGCNFDCSHCVSKKLIRASGRSAGKSHRMSWGTARKSIDYFLAFIGERGKKKAEIYFGGSEPMLNWGVFESAVNYCRSEYGQRFKFAFSTNTNASLINPERARFFSKNKVIVTSSLDGPLEINDSSRYLLSGEGTFEKVLRSWDLLGSFGKMVRWFCLTLTDKNLDGIDGNFLDFLASHGIVSFTAEPDLISALKKSPREVVQLLMRFKEEGEKRGITVGGLWDKPLKNLFITDVRKKLFNCSAFIGRGISVLPSGEIVLCTYSGKKFGSIDDLKGYFNNPELKTFLFSRAIGNIEECKGCEIEGQCMGGCFLTPEYCNLTNSSEAFNYRCEIYKLATRRLLEKAIDE